ncbi:cell wall elongation regulator TseB-like domain-containing protein [Paenibacillus hexagrammi]|uniref:DUF5590 domain-containing protein n=1 Tax=Paenibacillus hexagrammi TaxID=2908839 RepID=A0ABY3SQ88_9BACL|nr:DUF5590 domain-containing protein [Paenibacillus sp. YPD9-1]UJF36149.1 DUF5590 domain-containing protein [Paenibacillus sp. YPD9-1]
MLWRRVIMLGIFVLLTLIVVITRFYLSVQNEHWDANSKAVETAYEKTILTKATKVDSFYGDEPFQIIRGEDKIGQQVVVWISDKEVHTEVAAEAFTEDQVRETMLKKDPAIETLRILPGKLGSQYVWEVFYKKQEAKGLRYYYDYYTFKEGTYIDTYRLSLQ